MYIEGYMYMYHTAYYLKVCSLSALWTPDVFIWYCGLATLLSPLLWELMFGHVKNVKQPFSVQPAIYVLRTHIYVETFRCLSDVLTTISTVLPFSTISTVLPYSPFVRCQSNPSHILCDYALTALIHLCSIPKIGDRNFVRTIVTKSKKKKKLIKK